MFEPNSPLLTDLYQLNMLQTYLEHGLTETAVFELFFRKLPPERGFLMAAGLEQALDFLAGLRFGPAELDYLKRSGRFSTRFIEWLTDFRFTGDVDALPEGTIFFADEPAIRVVAPLPQAQLVETRLINLIHFQTLVAAKAARMVLVAGGRPLVDFGLRRAHGAEAGLLAARASYLAGFAGTATVLAEPLFGVPIFGTMAHSYIQAHDDEEQAFLDFARSRPQSLVLLLDTYDTEAAAAKVVRLAPTLRQAGIALRGVRIDSGDLADHARRVRGILDAGGLTSVEIMASGGLDEQQIQRLVQAAAPIDGYGVGTSLSNSSDRPALDCAYKLQEYAGVPRRKLSEGKATWPGRKTVWRRLGDDGRFAGDLITVGEAPYQGESLLRPVMRGARRLDGLPSLAEARAHAAAQLRCLPAPLAALRPFDYPVEIGAALRELAASCDRDRAGRRPGPSGAG